MKLNNEEIQVKLQGAEQKLREILIIKNPNTRKAKLLTLRSEVLEINIEVDHLLKQINEAIAEIVKKKKNEMER